MSGRPKRANPKRSERWRDILSAAAGVFSEKGYDGATLQEIADRSGILKGSIYHYINTKSDLLEQLLLEVHNESLALLRECAGMRGTALDRLAEMISTQIRYMCESPHKASVYFAEIRTVHKVRREQLFPERALRAEYSKQIKSGQGDGLIVPSLDPELTAQTLLSWNSSLHSWFRPRRGSTVEDVATHNQMIMLRGIATPRGEQLVWRRIADGRQWSASSSGGTELEAARS